MLYYVVYNPEYWRRDGQMPFEVYKLVNGSYQLQIGEPYWMPEIGLGIGRARDIPDLDLPEVLCWFDHSGRRYLIPEELAEQERQRADAAQQQVAELLARLRELGKEPRAGDT